MVLTSKSCPNLLAPLAGHHRWPTALKKRQILRSGGPVGRWVFVPVCACKEKRWAPGKFCRLSWDQWFEYMTAWDRIEKKKLLEPPNVLWVFAGPRGSHPDQKQAYRLPKRLMLMWGCYYYVVLTWVRTCQSRGPLNARPTCIATRGERGCCHSHTLAGTYERGNLCHCRPPTWQWHYLGGIVCSILPLQLH